MWSRAVLFTGLALIGTACSFGAEETTTTEAPAEVTTTTTPVTTIAVTTTTLEALAGPTFPDYTIARRVGTTDGRDSVVVLLDPSSYQILSDVDLYDVVADVVDRFPPIFQAYVVDSPEAADAVLAEEPTEEQLQILSEHYLLSLEEGFRLVYHGPFAELGTSVLGS
jgi:hypothetical protein